MRHGKTVATNADNVWRPGSGSKSGTPRAPWVPARSGSGPAEYSGRDCGDEDRTVRSGDQGGLAETSASECVQFEAEFTAALQRATAELDLAPAEEVLDRWWGIAAIRTNRLTEAERAQLARARAGDFTGLWECDEAGHWVQL
jgi:Family of unknown function (DUF6247)